MNNIINKCINIFKYIIIIVFLIVFIYLFKVIILDRNIYLNKLDLATNIYVYGDSSPRGRIYDRNYNLLVDNKSVPVIYYKKDKNISNIEEVKLAYKMINYIELDYSKITNRCLKDFWIIKNNSKSDELITSDEWIKYKEHILSDNDIYNLKIDRITSDEINNFTEEDRKASYMYYLMNNGYSYSNKIIKKNATDLEYSNISENSKEFNGFNTMIMWERVYLYGDTLKSILGSVGSIPKENKDYYLNNGYSINDKVGLSGLEYQYEDLLKGEKAKYIKKNNSTLEMISDAKRGNDIVLTIDINLELDVNNIIDKELLRAKKEPNTEYLSKTYAIIQEPNTGEILSISGRLINDNNFSDISSYSLTDPMTPGSVIKGASMIVGYNNNAIKIGETMTDECIKIKNIPKKCSSHRIGKLNDIIALAESSNVYQFKTAMRVANANYKYNENILFDEEAFDIYRKTFNEFGLGVKTGIDFPIESRGYSGKKRTIDLLLNYSIGQYDTYTPIQLSQYISTIANNGNRIKPHLLKEVYYSSNDNNLGSLYYSYVPVVLNKVNTDNIYINRIQEGFKAVMDIGLGKNVMGSVPNPAGKTGTSESFLDTNNDGVIDTETVSNSFVGYYPFDNPTMSITVTTPDVENPNTDISFHSYVNRRIARNVSNLYFEKYN